MDRNYADRLKSKRDFIYIWTDYEGPCWVVSCHVCTWKEQTHFIQKQDLHGIYICRLLVVLADPVASVKSRTPMKLVKSVRHIKIRKILQVFVNMDSVLGPYYVSK